MNETIQVEKLVAANIPNPNGRFGQYSNDAPDGWREITADQFAEQFFSWCIEWMDYRQICRVNGKELPTMIAAKLFWFNQDYGLALVQDYGKHTDYKQKLKYFAFGCKHNHESMSAEECKKAGLRLFRMDHASKCTKCGHIMVVDSSD